MFRMGISREEYLEYQLPGYPPLKDSEKPSKLSSDSGKPPKPSGKPETLKKVTCQRQEDECNSLSSASTTDTCTPKERMERPTAPQSPTKAPAVSGVTDSSSLYPHMTLPKKVTEGPLTLFGKLATSNKKSP